MKSIIYVLREDGISGIQKKAEYSLPADKALVAYIQQEDGNFNTWTYPETLPGMRESHFKNGHYYYDDLKRKRVVAAYPA